MELGATEVVTEEFCSSYEMASLIEVSVHGLYLTCLFESCPHRNMVSQN